MKKIGVLVLFLLFLSIFSFSIVLAENDTDANQAPEDTVLGQGDAEKIQNITDKLPIGDDGKLDQEKVGLYKSKAEQRIDTINQWLDKNARWLKLVFGMKPEISWIFIINLFLILYLFVVLYNGSSMAFPHSEVTPWAIGLCGTVLLIQLGFFLTIAETIARNRWWMQIVFVVIGLILAMASTYTKVWRMKQVKKGEEELERVNRAALQTHVNSLNRGSS